MQIEAQNLSGKKFKMTLDGFEARVFQHEYDHLDGVLFSDRLSPEMAAEVAEEMDKFERLWLETEGGDELPEPAFSPSKAPLAGYA